MNAPTRVVVNNARGESFADVARRLGAIGDIVIPSTYSDAEVMAALSSNFAEVVAAAGYTVIDAVATATSALNGDGNITMSGEQTIAGVLTSTSRVLLMDQTAPAENGIWVTAAGAWTRATDFDQTAEVVQGSYVPVTGGDNAGAWVLTTADPITVGTTAQTWRMWNLNQTLQLITDLASTASGKGDELIGSDDGASGTLWTTVKGYKEYHLANSIVYDTRFGCVGDGVADDTAELTAFFNHAIANPGIIHRLRPLTYVVSSTLPTINVSNVIVEGAGAMIHNSTGSGDIDTGCVFKWTGAAGGTMQTISSVSGASNLKVTGIKLTGITYNCNSLAAYGLKIYSVDKCEIEAGEMNATTAGFYMGVVAALDDARDCQNNLFRLYGRQVEAPGGTCLQCVGDTGANVSLNRFHCDFLHYDVPAIQLYGNDNNDWDFVRLYKPGGGAATSGVNCNGGNTATTNTRSERFHYLISTMPLYALGTESGVTNPAIDISIYNVDKSNGTPDPIIGTGASVYWRNDDTPLEETPWSSFTPTVTAGSGTFTTVSATGKYLKRGVICHYQIVVTITTNGTAASYVRATLPFAENSSTAWVATGKNNTTGVMLTGVISGGASVVDIQRYDGVYSGADGQTLEINGFYSVA